MFHLNEDFKSMLSPAKWRNKVSAFLNNICGDGIIDIHKPENPNSGNPPVVKIKIPALVNRLKYEGYGDITHPLALRQTYSVNGTTETVNGLLVYLPTLTFTKDGTDYAIETGTSTGQVSAHQEFAGWYTINGITTGEVWLVDDSTSTTKRMKFATAEVSGKPCHHLGKSAATGVTQYPVVMNAKMQGAEGGGAVEAVKPLTIRAVVNAAKTAIDHLEVYLPSTTVGFGRVDYPILTGTSSGYIQSVGDGWYKIGSLKTGTIWLVDASTAKTTSGVTIWTPRVKFAAAAVGVNKVSHLVATVSYTSGQAAAVVSQADPMVKGWVGDSETEHNGQTALDITLTTSANDLAVFQQEGHSLNTDTWTRGQSVVSAVTRNGDTQTITPITDNDGNQQPAGTKIRCFTRVIRAVDIDWFIYRELEFDANGCLRSISAEKGVHGECNYAYS